MLFPDMSSLLRTNGRLTYSIYTTFRRAFQLSSNGTDFEKFEDKNNNNFSSTSNEEMSVNSKNFEKQTTQDQIKERFEKVKERLQMESLKVSVNNYSVKVKEEKRFHEHDEGFIRTQRLKRLEKEGKIQQAVKEIEIWMLEKSREKQKEMKVSMPNIYKCSIILNFLERHGYIDQAFDMYDLMLELGPEPDNFTYSILFNACSKSSLSKQEILEKVNQLRNDITDRCLEKNKVVNICMIRAFVKGNDIKSAIDTTIFLLDELENESQTSSLGDLFHLLHALHDDKQRGFHHAIRAWRIITPRVQCFKPGLAEFNKLLLITFDCGIGSEEEFQKMLQETEYPCSFTGCWNGSKGHDVKKCASFAAGEKDLTKVEPTKFPLGTENYHRNKESKLKKNRRSEFNEVVELVEEETFQEKGERKSTELSLDLLLPSLPSNVEREHKISDILNPFETLPSIIGMPRIVTSEDRMNLLGGPKEILIRMYKAGIVPNIGIMVNLLKLIPLTLAVESSLLILTEDTDPTFIFVLYGAIVDRILKRKDNAAAKEILRVIKHYGMTPPDVVLLSRLCKVIDNESDVFQHLNYMQMTGIHPDVVTFIELFSLHWSLYDFAYRKKLLMEMSWLNIFPDERILRKLKTINERVSRDLLEQENGMIKAGCDDKPYISREEFEDFMTFYNEWLAMYNLQS